VQGADPVLNGLVADRETEIIIGRQQDDRIVPLTEMEIETCRLVGLTSRPREDLSERAMSGASMPFYIS
jgi:hypothetical protein